MISDDEYLERIVAGIHAITSEEADVRWNEKLNGRQFDVVLRFQLGTLKYLVLIEVKNRSRPASASDVEAFVTKARDQNADKSVFVTAAGFQHGALSVARKHGVDLFTVKFDELEASLSETASVVVHQIGDPLRTDPPRLTVGEPRLVGAVEDVTLNYVDGRKFKLPTESTQMNYYVHRSSLGDGRKLAEFLSSLPQLELEAGQKHREQIRADPPVELIPPDDHFFPRGKIASADVLIVGRMGRGVSGNTLVEPTSFRPPVVYTNVLTGETHRYTLDQLPLNMEQVEVGKFYFQVHPLRYFHCAAVIGDQIEWDLIESFQNNSLVRATFYQDSVYSRYFIPVSEKQITSRLRKRLIEYRGLQARNRS